MAAALPLGKLLGLVVKQVSKPVANQLKSYGKTSERFERYYISIGNAIHRLQVRVFRQSASEAGMLSWRKKVKDLPPDKALDVGASFIGDAFVYFVAAGVTVFEYSRQRSKEARKTLKRAEAEECQRREIEEAMAEKDRKLEELSAAIPLLDQKIELLREDFDKFQGTIISSLQLLNINSPLYSDTPQQPRKDTEVGKSDQ